MTYNTSSPTVKCEKCEEHLTDFEQYEKHMAHMHGSNTSEESVVDWTLITDEDIITKDGNKYRVGGESINWSPNFDKEARIFLEEKYQKGRIEMLSKKKISEAKKFVKALETDTNQHYDNLINKIEGKGEDSYKELFPNKEQKFPQNKMPTAKWFSHQRDEAGVTDVGIQDQGYFDDPNAVMGLQTKRFSKGKYHIDEPVAKEQFSTSFYGEYLGESKASEDAIGSDIDFGKLLNETPYDEQQRRLRTARDEQSPLDNIYHSKRVADDIAGGTRDTYAQDFIGGSDGKALYDDYDDLAPNWFYDSTGVKTKKLGELKANEEQQDPEDACQRCGKNRTTHQYLDHDFSQESKAREHQFVLGYSDPECNICGRVIHNSFEQNDDREAMQDAIYQHYNYEHSDIKNVKQLAGQQIYDQFRKTEESKANEVSAEEDEVAQDLWIALGEGGLKSDYINGGIFKFDITYPDWVTDITQTNSIAWSELTSTDQQNVVNHFGGVEGMKEKLCDEGWDQYCEDEDGYESKASDDYEVDVDEYIKTGDPTQELPKDKRGY